MNPDMQTLRRYLGVLAPILLFLLFSYFTRLPTLTNTASFSTKTLPNPQKSPQLCGRPHRSSICDPDHYLSRKSAANIEALINDIESGKNNFKKGTCGGNEIGVGILRTISGGGDGMSRAKQLAKKVHTDWGVGKRECENGIVLVVAVEDRAMYISTGKGVKGVLTPDRIEREIFKGMRGLLREKEYGKAIKEGVWGIGQVLSGRKGNGVDSDGFGVMHLLAVIFVGFLVLGWWLERKSAKRFSKCKELLGKLEKNRTNAKNKKEYEAKSCPICLEDFEGDAVESKSPPESSKGAKIAASKVGEKKEKKVICVLHCGHKFHKKCISDWIDARHGICPVCRRSIDPEESEQRSSSNTPVQSDTEAELNFRLTRLQSYYPEYIRREMLRSWLRSEFRGSYIRDFCAAHTTPTSSSTYTSTASSTSFSYGGGSSSGGGGGGSSW